MKIYTLLLLLFCLSCKKQPTDPLSHTSKMAGVHTWTGLFHSYSNTVDTTYNISQSDTITVLNNKTLVMFHYAFSRATTSVDTFKYLQQTNDTLVFTSYFLDAHLTYDEEADTIKYAFSNNVINLNQRYYSQYGSWTKQLRTP